MMMREDLNDYVIFQKANFVQWQAHVEIKRFLRSFMVAWTTGENSFLKINQDLNVRSKYADKRSE